MNEEERQKELDSILNNPDIQYCYILKRGLYYCDSWCGYSDYRTKAGVYTKQEAIDHARNIKEIFIVPINNAEHNTLISKEIEKLKARLI